MFFPLLCFFSFLSFFWIQVWELGADDNWYYVDTAWCPHGELSNWKRYSAYTWEDWGHSWEELVGRVERNLSLNVCATQDIFETSFYARRWTADQPPNPAEWRASCEFFCFSLLFPCLFPFVLLFR